MSNAERETWFLDSKALWLPLGLPSPRFPQAGGPASCPRAWAPHQRRFNLAPPGSPCAGPRGQDRGQTDLGSGQGGMPSPAASTPGFHYSGDSFPLFLALPPGQAPKCCPKPPPSCPPWQRLPFPSSTAALSRLPGSGEPHPLALGCGPLSSPELGPTPCFTDNGSGDHPGVETGLRVSRSYRPCSREL